MPTAPLEFDVLEGRAQVLEECADTIAFLGTLAELDKRASSQEAAATELPEKRAARGIFRFDVSSIAVTLPRFAT